MDLGSLVQNVFLGGIPAMFGGIFDREGKARTPNSYDELFSTFIPMMADEMGYTLNVTTDSDGNRHYDMVPTQATIDRRARQGTIDQLTYDAQVRALTGQVKLFPQQEEFLNNAYAANQATAVQGYNQIRSEIDKGQADVNSVLNEFNGLITKSGVSRNNALDVISNIIEQGGNNYREALQALTQQVGTTDKTVGQEIDKSFTKARELAAIGLRDQADQMRQQTAKQAALLGRSPMDPQFQYQLQNLTQKNIAQTDLALGVAEANARTGLASDTGSKREAIAQQYANLEQQLTGQRAGVAQERYNVATDVGNQQMNLKGLQANLAQLYGGMRIGAAQNQAGVMNALQSNNQQNRYNLAMGLPYQQAQLGMNTQQLQSQLQSGNIGQAQGMFNAFSSPYNTESSRLGYTRDFWDYLNTIGALGATAAKAMA